MNGFTFDTIDIDDILVECSQLEAREGNEKLAELIKEEVGRPPSTYELSYLRAVLSGIKFGIERNEP